MMNLSINLTLGSPGAESVLNTAPAPEDGAVDSFSLKLADELSEQELTPPIRVEDTRAVDPALLEAIAARQKLAADAETATAKDGRVWLDDPLVGLPVVTDTAAELVETVTEDKPWLDIIEKAKSYGPALQANKTTADDSAAAAITATTAENSVVSATDGHQAAAVLAAALLKSATDDVTSTQTTPDSASAGAESLPGNLDNMLNSGNASVSGTEQTLLPVQQLTTEDQAAAELTTGALSTAALSAGELNAAKRSAAELTTQDKAGVVATAAVSSPAADEKVSNETPVVSGAAQRSVTTEAATAQAKSTTKPEPLRTEPNTTGKAASKTAAVTEAVTETADAAPAHAASPDALTGAVAEQAATPAQTQQQGKVANQQSAVALHENAEVIERTEPELPAAMMVQAQAAPANTNRATVAASGSLDKAPAANAFAEHLKTVNQTQQQQQQAGAEQQTGQGQAKATADVMLANQPAQPAATTLAFGQQLQQLQQAQPSTEHTATVTALTQPVTHSAGTAHTPLMPTRAAETTSWQAPLALSEPAAAQQLKDRVMVQIQHKLQTAEVQLHPEDLGSMQIKLNLQQDQLSVQFVVQQSAAKEALEQQMPRLRELLEQQGIALTEGQVEQRQSGGQQDQRQARSGPSGGNEADLATVQTVQMKVSDRMVDFYA